MRVLYSRRALVELDRVLRDYQQKYPAALPELKSRLSQIEERIGQYPYGYQEVEHLVGVRRAPMLRFPYLVFYRVRKQDVVVLRIRHGARREPWEDL